MEEIQTKNNFLGTVIKGSLYAVCASLILILIFAFMLRFFGVSDTALTIFVQIIKGMSIIIGVYLGMKKSKELGFISGLVIGLLFTIISFLAFSILDGFNFEISKTLLSDIIFGTLIGGIAGIIAVNLKK